MEIVFRSRRYLLLAALSLLLAACGSQSDPKALPSWIAAYPGSTPQPAGSTSGPKGRQSEFIFQTKDSAEQVLSFYQRQLIQKGLHMEARGGGEYGGMLSAQDDSRSRSVMINVRAGKDASDVSIIVVEK